MKKSHDPKSALFDILSCSKNCIDFTQGMTLTTFEKDLKTISAVQHQLMIIGEATKKLPEDFRNAHKDIPWKKMAGTETCLFTHMKKLILKLSGILPQSKF